MKYRVKFKYEAYFETEVEAENESDALKNAISETEKLDDDELAALVASTLKPVGAELDEIS